MTLERTAVMEFLHARGEDVKAREAGDRLPETFDPGEERYGGVLRNLGVDPEEVVNGIKPESQTPSGTSSSFPTSS